jgi:hypothetical protein
MNITASLRPSRRVRQAGQGVVVGHVVDPRLGLAALDDLGLQQPVGAGQFGGALLHPHLELVARAAHRVGGFALGGDVVDQPDAAAAALGQVERPARQSRPEARAVAPHQFVFGHVHAAGREIALGLLARRRPAGRVRVQRAHRDAVDRAARVAEQLFHLAVAAQRAPVFDHGDAQHGVVEDGLVLQHGVAQRFLVALLAGAVLDHPDRALARVGAVDGVADQPHPHRRAVLAHHDALGLEGLALPQHAVGLRAKVGEGLLVGVQDAGQAADGFAILVAEHAVEGTVGARDHAFAREEDPDRGVGHDRLHLGQRAARLGHVFQDPDGAGFARAHVDRLGADAAPDRHAVAAAQLDLGLFEQIAGRQHPDRFRREGVVLGVREEELGRVAVDQLARLVAQHVGHARVAGLDQVRQGDDDADRGVFEHGRLLQLGAARGVRQLAEHEGGPGNAGLRRQRARPDLGRQLAAVDLQHAAPAPLAGQRQPGLARRLRSVGCGEQVRQHASFARRPEQALECLVGRPHHAVRVAGARRRRDQRQRFGHHGRFARYTIHPRSHSPGPSAGPLLTGGIINDNAQ